MTVVGHPVLPPNQSGKIQRARIVDEKWNLFETRMDNTFTIPVVFGSIMQYEISLKKYPNIKHGEEFTGYKTALPKSA